VFTRIDGPPLEASQVPPDTLAKPFVPREGVVIHPLSIPRSWPDPAVGGSRRLVYTTPSW
jgi:hypothetical protein